MRIATWNVNSMNVRLPRVLEWLELAEPDVLCLQETKQSDEKFPHEQLKEAGYDSVHHGEGRWNGVAILSRVGIEEVTTGFGPDGDERGARLIGATCGGVRILSCYVPNGRSLDSEHFEGKLAWMDQLCALLRDSPADQDVVALGDFNIAPDDADVWDPEALIGMTHVSPQERAKLAALTEIGFDDVFRRFYPDGGVFSWWDYRDGAFHKGHGMRIDLIMASASLAERAVGAYVDREARKGHTPSDHAPVVADFS